MSTRCNIEIYTGPDVNDHPVILYHHSDGYPSAQLPKLDAYLKGAFDRLSRLGYPYWWDSERVAAMMIFLSANTYSEPALLNEEQFTEACDKTTWQKPLGYPHYQPCARLHGDIEFLYRVHLLHDGRFRIDCYREDGTTKLASLTSGENAEAIGAAAEKADDD